MRVDPVVSESDFADFVRMPLTRPGRDRYVPLLEPTLRSWWSGDHPGARFGPVRLYVARDAAGAPVGRTFVHHNPVFDDRLGADTQLFGCTEFTNPDVLTALLAEVEREGRRAGRTAAFGPVALLPNQTGGVVTSGFAERGFMDSPWNPPEYPQAYESLGWTRRFEGQTWICEDLGDLDVDATFGPDRSGSEGLRVVHGNRFRLRPQLEAMRTVLNASFAALPYYTQIGAADLAAQTDGLNVLLDESLFLQLELDGTVLAFILVVPDVSEFVMERGGRLGVRDQLALLARLRRKKFREAILIIKGTKPEAQGRGYLTILSRELLANLQAGGYQRLRSTFVGHDNAASAAQYVRMGGRPLHETTFYGKEIVDVVGR